jgi:MFS transporter, SP family, inositol transporter
LTPNNLSASLIRVTDTNQFYVEEDIMSQTTARKAPHVWYIAIVCGMASYLDAAALVSSGLALVIYQQTIGVTADQLGLLTALLTFFGAAGAATGGRLGDRFGRRPVFTITMLFVIAGASLMAFTDSFALLIAGIIVLGFGVGADLPVALATVSEASTDKNRGGAVVLSHVLWTVGILAALAISVAVGGSGRMGATILFGQVAVIGLIVLLLRLRIPESALWLKARTERAQGITTIRADRVKFKDLLRAPYALPLVVLGVSYTLLALGASTFGGFGAFIAVNLANVDVPTFSLVALGLTVLSIGATVWFMKAVDTRWRMTFFAVGAVMIVAGYGVIAAFGFSLITLAIGMFLSNIGMCFAFETIIKVWMQESFPTLLRTSAQGTIMAFARLLPVPVQAVTPALLLANGHLFFAGLALAAAIAGALLWFTFRNSARNQFDVETQNDPEIAVAAAPR